MHYESSLAVGVKKQEKVTPRSILIGCVLIPVNCYWVIAMEQVWKSGNPSTLSIFFNAIFTLLVMLILNELLKYVSPKIAFSRAELITIYSMICIGTGLSSQDWIQVALPSWAHPIWHSSPENNWQELFLNKLPSWLIVTDKSILGPFYTGRETFYRLHFMRSWLRPVLWWTLFFSVIQLVMLSINTILYRQWTEREKLSFPITQLPLEITRRDWWIYRQNGFWLGFLIGTTLDTINGLHEFFPSIPQIRVKMMNITPMLPAHPFGAMGFTPISLFPFVIAIGYLLPLDFCFSSWFFYLFFKAQIVIGAYFGWQGSMGYEGVQGSLPYVNEQGIGAYIALFVIAIWSARAHLIEVFAEIIGKGPKAPKAGKNWHKMATVGLLGGMGFLILFSLSIGMSIPISLAFFSIYFALCTVISKIRAEFGPPVHDLHFGGPDRILITLLGSTNLRKEDLIGLSLYFGFNRAYRAIPMPYQLEALKMTDSLGGNTATTAIALLIAAPIASLSACWAMLHWAYQVGLSTTMTESYRFGGQAWLRLYSWLTSPWKPNIPAAIAMLIGALFATALMILRFIFPPFPLHPLGYTISSNWAINCVWFPLMIASIIKFVTLRYLGIAGYRAGIPIAIGVILGEFTTGSLWSILGLIMRKHTYAFWLF